MWAVCSWTRCGGRLDLSLMPPPSPQVGAVGLDLSFVTHVFLMEPLADKSMEEQVGLSTLHGRSSFLPRPY